MLFSQVAVCTLFKGRVYVLSIFRREKLRFHMIVYSTPYFIVKGEKNDFFYILLLPLL